MEEPLMPNIKYPFTFRWFANGKVSECSFQDLESVIQFMYDKDFNFKSFEIPEKDRI